MYIGLQGIDTGGNLFTRQQTTIVQPLQGIQLLLKQSGIGKDTTNYHCTTTTGYTTST